MEATLSSKNQATIPRQVREYLQLRPGDKFKFFLQPDGTVALLPRVPVGRLKGTVPSLNRPASVEEINKAIEAGAAERLRK